MSDWNEFGAQRGAMTPCALCDAMVPDAMDESLTAAELAWFEQHVAECTACAAEWADAQHGAAWLTLLKAQPPQVPATLLHNVLAATSAAGSAPLSTVAVASPATAASPAPVAMLQPRFVPAAAVATPHRARVLPFLRRPVPVSQVAYAGMHPRLAMTAAMAFFSLALTANMLGVRPGDLRPGHLEPALRRTFTDSRSSLIRTVLHAPLVSQVEAKLDLSMEAGPQQ